MSKAVSLELLEERKKSVCLDKKGKNEISCEKDSVSGSVSQRACVYCGSRVVLNPITDAYHVVHGPIGCASYTWDIRGSLTSGPETYRNSFSTDLAEEDVIFGGERKLSEGIDELAEKHAPGVIFVYATCIAGVIGDDVDAVCRRAEKKHGIRVVPVKASGFAGSKKDGYKAACNALMKLMGEDAVNGGGEGANFLGDFNLSGEMWIIKGYLESIGIRLVSTITGDARCADILKAPSAALNIVQCAGSMTYLAKRMEDRFGIPYIKVRFFGVRDTGDSLLRIAEALGDAGAAGKARAFIMREETRIRRRLEHYRERLEGRKAAIYVGGGFKAISLIRQFEELGMKTVLVGTQTGKRDEYDAIRQLAEEDAVILDDANPAELEGFMREKGADILVGGVKERPLAYKLGVAFCDHNHERKHPLCGYEGAVNFASEVDSTINSPVWKYTRSREPEGSEGVCERRA